MTYPRFDQRIEYFGAGPDGPLGLPTLDQRFINDDEEKLLKKLRSNIMGHAKRNALKQNYYEAKQVVEHLEIAVPAHLSNIGVAVGWAGTTVDAIDERIDWLGWSAESGNLNGLDNVYIDNELSVESGFGHVDSLTTGLGLVTVGKDPEGDKEMLVTVESTSTATLIWDYAKRRSLAGLSQTTDDEGNIVLETLYMQNVNISFARDPLSGQLEIIQRNDHGLNRCFMTRLPNKARPYQLDGRSEITAAVRYYTDAAVRTMLGMEVNREFYTAPQRFVLNANPADFGVTNDMSAEEKYRKGLSVAMGMINIVPPRTDNTEGDPPSVMEFRPAPPTPFIEQIKAYSIQMSAETGLPATLFGFVTDNPTSGDAIVKSEFRLTRKAQRRIGAFGQGWKEVAYLSLLGRDGSVDRDFMRQLRCKFANPMLPTPSATSDEIQKMIAAGVLVPDSSVTYDLYGRLDDPQMRAMLDKDKAKYEAKQLRQAMQEQSRAVAVANATKPAAPGGSPTTAKPAADKAAP